jgi:hypothetical protein
MNIKTADNDFAKRLQHSHITLRVRCLNTKGQRRGVDLDSASIIVFDCPATRDHTDHSAGRADKVAYFHPGTGLKMNQGADPARFWVARQVFHHVTQGGYASDLMELILEDYCGRCSRPLNDPESVKRGLGPECYGKETKSHHQVHEQRRQPKRRDQMIMETA